jgi:hypothetical protein
LIRNGRPVVVANPVPVASETTLHGL